VEVVDCSDAAMNSVGRWIVGAANIFLLKCAVIV